MLLFCAAAIGAGGAVGAVCGAFGGILLVAPSPVRIGVAVVLAIVALIYGLGEVFGMPLPVPQRSREIPARWAWYGQARFAVVFGAMLGAGFFTIIPFIGYHLLLTTCVLLADPVRGSALVGLFGATRTLPALVAPWEVRLRRRSCPSRPPVISPLWTSGMSDRLAPFRGLLLFSLVGTLLAMG